VAADFMVEVAVVFTEETSVAVVVLVVVVTEEVLAVVATAETVALAVVLIQVQETSAVVTSIAVDFPITEVASMCLVDSMTKPDLIRIL